MVRFVALTGIALSFALFLAPVGAIAAGDDEVDRTGVYRSIGGLLAFNAKDDGQSRDNITGGIEAAIGFQQDAYSNGLFVNWLEGSQQISFGVEAKVFPLSIGELLLPKEAQPDSIRPYFSLGIGLMNAEYVKSAKNIHRWGGVLRLGAGVDTYVTDRMAVTLNYEYRPGTGGLHHINHHVVGIGVKLIGL